MANTWREDLEQYNRKGKQVRTFVTCLTCHRVMSIRRYNKHICYIPKKKARYGIAFIPTAIIVCSNLYNTGFI